MIHLPATLLLYLQLWDRELPVYKSAEVEGVDMDDWMVVDR